jgi:hypothetical protein
MSSSANIQDVEVLSSIEQELSDITASTVDYATETRREIERFVECIGEEKQRATEYLTKSQEANEQALTRLADSERAYEAAEARLESARSVLSRRMSSSGSWQDEDSSETDTSSEEADVQDAESLVAQVSDEVENAKECLDNARLALEGAHKWSEAVSTAVTQSSDLNERLQTASARWVRAIGDAMGAGTGLLGDARSAIQGYLAGSSGSTLTHGQLSSAPPALRKWLEWDPRKSGDVVTPKHIHDRLSPPPEILKMYVMWLAQADPQFHREVERLRDLNRNAAGPVEQQAVYRQMQIHLRGMLGEKLVQHALGPLGSRVTLQRSEATPDGRKTRVDIVIEDLKVPVVLHRGEGMSAPQGGSIAIEVKTGSPNYLYSERDHLEHQAKGHQSYSASFTVCTRDINDLEQEKQDELRGALRKAGSPLVGMLPYSSDLDDLCLNVVREDENQ